MLYRDDTTFKAATPTIPYHQTETTMDNVLRETETALVF